MANVELGTKAVGSIVKLKVNGALQDFIVVHQGKPSSLYDETCNGTWLLMKDCLEAKRWHSSDVNDYANSEVHSYLNSTVLSKFDANIRAQIKQVKIQYRPGNGTSETVNSGADGFSVKIFLLSGREVGYTKSNVNKYICNDGTKLAYFIEEGNTGGAGCQKRIAYYNDCAVSWWLRSPYLASSTHAWAVDSNGGVNGYTCSWTGYYLRPALILPTSLLVSDDGSVTTNTAPSAPASVTVPNTVYGGLSATVTWGAAADPDGDTVTYALERQIDGGDWAQIYTGANLSYTDTIIRGWTSVAYRVKAIDSRSASGPYTTSPTQIVNNNIAPIITCSQFSGADMGVKDSGFSVAYSVDDPDGDAITVTEEIDGVTQRTYKPEPGADNTFTVAGETFMCLLNGTHTMTITASDGQMETVHELTFTKEVTEAGITLREPFAADDKITICVLSVAGDIPADADFTVEVTNNALDDNPVWENCTKEVKNGGNHIFTNETAVNGFSFNFRVKVKRGPSGQGGYINSVQGGFQ